jgi:hypothetical protein
MENTSGNIVMTGGAGVTMNWGAIFGGWLVATGIASMMFVAGLAIGFSRMEPFDTATPSTAVATGTAAWVILTWAVSLLLGGMFASWFDGKADQTVGTLHGITAWGLFVTVNGLLFMMGVAHVVHGAATAGTAPHYNGAAMCVMFLSIFIGLIAAAVGGWLGAGHIHKVHHLRRYESAPAVRTL